MIAVLQPPDDDDVVVVSNYKYLYTPDGRCTERTQQKKKTTKIGEMPMQINWVFGVKGPQYIYGTVDHR